MIHSIVNSGFFYLGQTLQEVKDVYTNGVALYQYSGLEKSRNGKELTAEECLKLWILDSTRRSRLFIFKNYTFEITPSKLKLRVKLIPTVENSISLVALFCLVTLYRLVKVVAILVFTIFFIPLVAAVYLKDPFGIRKELVEGWKAGTSHAFEACCYPKVLSLPIEPSDSHVTAEDVNRIGRLLIGYRHVSTEDYAQENAQKGIPDGCALNISFCDTESPRWDTATFKDLDKRVKSGENCSDLIRKYEKAITEFIVNSIFMDFDSDPKTVGEFLTSLDKTRFMIIKTRFYSASDVTSYGGLGRFAKARVKPKHIILLRRLQKEELGIPPETEPQKLSCNYENELLANYLASHYRRELLRYLREDLNPKGFRFSFF